MAGPLFCYGDQMVITSKLTDEELIESIYKAANAYEKLEDNTYLIIGKNKRSEYYWFQCHFDKKNFMHLLGIKSQTLSADEFYERCIKHNIDDNVKIAISDCTPSRNHSRTTINEKCSCCADMLNINDAVYMKVGDKNKISQYVDFSYAYGNIATMGFSAKNTDVCFPITLIPKNIDEFASKKYRIVFVFEKSDSEDKYKFPLIEIKKDLFLECYEEMPDDLKELIIWK